MQRAYSHGRELADMMQKVMVDVPTQGTLNLLDEVRERDSPTRQGFGLPTSRRTSLLCNASERRS